MILKRVIVHELVCKVIESNIAIEEELEKYEWELEKKRNFQLVILLRWIIELKLLYYVIHKAWIFHEHYVCRIFLNIKI
jgi:hypothetical protein